MADDDILLKELELNKGLIAKGIEKLSPEFIAKAVEQKELTEEDHKLFEILLQLVSLVSSGKLRTFSDWAEVKQSLLDQKEVLRHQLHNYAILVENGRIADEDIKTLKEDFTDAQPSEKGVPGIFDLRELLCEAFCLVDILNEIQMSLSPERRHTPSVPLNGDGASFS